MVEEQAIWCVAKVCHIVLVHILLLFLGFFRNTLCSNFFLPKRESLRTVLAVLMNPGMQWTCFSAGGCVYRNPKSLWH